jgi:isopenicillin N synthase-like dioxygenase
MTVVNHQVPQAVIDSAWKDTRMFFDLPASEKVKATSVNEAEYPYGYVGFGDETLSAGKVCCACHHDEGCHAAIAAAAAAAVVTASYACCTCCLWKRGVTGCCCRLGCACACACIRMFSGCC